MGMTLQTEVRELTLDELDAVTGASKVSVEQLAHSVAEQLGKELNTNHRVLIQAGGGK